MITRLSWLVLGVAVLLSLGCERRPTETGPVAHAALGIFFGGQVQERQEIPFTLDRAKQTQGFVVEFAAPLTRPLKIHWEIDRPQVRGKGRLTEIFDSEARVGQTRFDQEIRFEPGHPLGTWNFRVMVENQIVIDRPVLIYDARARRRAMREASEVGKDKR
jgi:hypothetical protein